MARRTTLERLSVVVIIALVVFLLASVVALLQKVDSSNAARDRALAALKVTNDGIVAKLADVFAQVSLAEQAAEAAGKIPQQTVDQVVAGLRGYVDPALVAAALKKAGLIIAGPQGPRGPQGPSGPSSSSSSTVTTATATTTATTRATVPTTTSQSTTTSSSTTTTTRPCLIDLLGIRLGC